MWPLLQLDLFFVKVATFLNFGYTIQLDWVIIYIEKLGIKQFDITTFTSNFASTLNGIAICYRWSSSINELVFVNVFTLQRLDVVRLVITKVLCVFPA